VAVELSVTEIPFMLPGGETIMLRGAIDKIERSAMGAIRIVDYKTGTPKSRNDILGLTKGSTGDIKRQLDFYRLLLERYHDGEYVPQSALVEFVEERDNGTISGEEFPLSESDSQGIAPVITTVATEILTLAFLGRTCDDPECRYCPLRGAIAS
jgi:hypothetical protein